MREIMLSNFAFLDLGTPELIIILLIVLLLFGGKKLPEISKNLAEGIKELRKGFSESSPEPPKAKDEKPSK